MPSLFVLEDLLVVMAEVDIQGILSLGLVVGAFRSVCDHLFLCTGGIEDSS